MNDEHLKILEQGAVVWNRWREDHPEIRPEIRDANLSGRNLRGFNFEGAFLRGVILNEARVDGANFAGVVFDESRLIQVDLTKANFGGNYFGGALLWRANLAGLDLRTGNFSGAQFQHANLSKANLSGSTMQRVDLSSANLSDALLVGTELSSASLVETNLTGADLSGANLVGAYIVNSRLCGANLSGASLQAAAVIQSDLSGANLTGSRVFGISAWNLSVAGTTQKDIIITPDLEPVITCDDIEVAQFIYLLLKNEKVRQVIDTVTAKAVLILGRFSAERKAVLDAVRDELRRRNFTPILFDFDKPESKDVTGTVETLARLARFIIADLTDPSSIPHEMAMLVPYMRTTPILPIRLEGAPHAYSMFDDFKVYPWVLATHEYKDSDSLISELADVIAPADQLAQRLRTS